MLGNTTQTILNELNLFISQTEELVGKEVQEAYETLNKFKIANPVETGIAEKEHKEKMEEIFNTKRALKKAKKFRKFLRSIGENN
jgi:hypothetical protein